MPTVGYPSDDFPPPPRFGLAVPDGWEAFWPPGTLFAVTGPAAADGIHPNVLVAWQRLPEAASFDGVVQEAVSQLRQAVPHRDLDTPARVKSMPTGRSAVVDSSFADENGARVQQRQILLQFASRGRGTSLLEITATYGAADAETMRGIIDSLWLGPAEVSSLRS